MTNRKKAVVLLSGGLDSTTVLAIAKNQGYEPHALSFRYGQRHLAELESARRVVSEFGPMPHIVADIDLHTFGGSALTDDIDVPRYEQGTGHDHGHNHGHGHSDDDTHSIPVTYVPARNTVFLSFALAWAEVLQSQDVFIGVNAMDYSGYPDCRPEYIEAYERMANLATKAGVEGTQQLKIHAPLMQMTKAQIISTGIELGVDYGLTHSCYDPDKHGTSCGTCDACILRLRGFSDAGVTDPLPYQ